MIRHGDEQAISKMMMRLRSDTEITVRGSLELSYYSRGAWDYDTILNMSAAEREIAMDIIKKKIEMAAKNPAINL